jgi:hypothetical protein
MSKEIPITKGKITIVDDCDYEYLNQWKWYCSSVGYAVRDIPCNTNNRKRKTILMHREILNTPDGMDTDHINHNTLDNRKCNLRICTRSQNEANKGLRRDNTSGIKGISWNKQIKKWHAQMKQNGKLIHVGYFSNIEDAINSYLTEYKEFYGEFAMLEKIGGEK